jgi:hypothetical protein
MCALHSAVIKGLSDSCSRWGACVVFRRRYILLATAGDGQARVGGKDHRLGAVAGEPLSRPRSARSTRTSTSARRGVASYAEA